MCSSSTNQTHMVGKMADGQPLELSGGLQQAPAGELGTDIPRPTVKSPFRGLSWDRKNNGWRVRIYFAGKQRHVGRFDDDVAAAKAYDKAAVYLYGSHAITNYGLEACHADPTEVSTFIVLAKEQAEQEQLARQQHRQQYSLRQMSLPSGVNASYALPQQTYLAQQQQQQQAGMGYVCVQGENGTAVPACASIAGTGGGAVQGTYTLAPPNSGMHGLTVMQGTVQQTVSPQQQQVWAPVVGNMSLRLQEQQQQQVGVQAVGRMPQMAGTYVSIDPSTGTVTQYPSASHVDVGSAQGMQVLGAQPQQQFILQGTAGPVGASASPVMMLGWQQPQPQHFILQDATMPAQQGDLIPAGGYTAEMSRQVSVSVSAVSNAPVAAPLGMAGQHEMLLQQGPGQILAGEGSPSACSIGGGAFVRDMLSGLNYAAAGQTSSPFGLHQQQQQQRLMGSMVVQQPQTVSWLPADGLARSAGQTAASWAMVQAPLAAGQGFPMPAGLTDASPTYSATSSTSASTSTGLALPLMCAASSTACS